MVPADPHSKAKVCGLKPNTTINGYRVYLDVAHRPGFAPSQGLCTDQADGLAISFGEQGAHPRVSVAQLFRSHLRLLGNNPKNWTTEPVK